MRSLSLTLLSLFVLVGVAGSQTKFPKIVISTDYGDIKIVLYDETPRHSSNFLNLVKTGRYDNAIFHRVIQDFMIQAGASRSASNSEKVNESVKANLLPEFNDNYIHKRGALAMARSSDDENPKKISNDTEFYIVQGHVYPAEKMDSVEQSVNIPIKNKYIKMYYTPEKDYLASIRFLAPIEYRTKVKAIHQKIDSALKASPDLLLFSELQRELYTTIGGAHHLDGEYTVFGEVYEGLDVVDKIAAQKVGRDDRPLDNIVIKKAYILKD